MARIRTIKPDFWTSEQICNCKVLTRLFFIGMWNFFDDDGVHPISAFKLKNLIFPSENLSIECVNEMIEELKINNLLEEITFNDKQFWRITGWKNHQVINHHSSKYLKSYPQDEIKTHVALREHSHTEGKGKEGNKINTTLGSSLGDYPHKNCPPVDMSIIFKIPCRGGHDFSIREYQLEQWQSLYPQINVKKEIEGWISWLTKNQTKLPNKNNFIDRLMRVLKNSYPNTENKKPKQKENQVMSNVVPFTKHANHFIEDKIFKAV